MAYTTKTDRDHFRESLPEIKDDLKELLEDMLQFNPYIRLSATECLANPVFD